MRIAASWRSRMARVFLADPLRKLLALALGVLVWLYLNSQVVTRVELSLQLVPRPEGQLPLPSVQRLSLRLDPQLYQVVGYDDAATGVAIDGVMFAVSGSQSQVAAVSEEEPYVEPTPEELRAGGGAFVFTLERVLTRDPALRQLLRRMQPRAVRVRVDRLEERKLRLVPAMLVRPQSAERRSAFEPIDLQEARFYPEDITFRGPREELQRLFSSASGQPLLQFGSEAAPPTSGAEWRTTVRVDAELTKAVKLVEPEIQVTFPLHPHFTTFEVEVPVLLDQTSLEGAEAAGAGLLVEPPLAKVTLAVSGQLEAELRQKSPEELRLWARRTARLMAVPPAGRPPTGPVTVLAQLILYDAAYREGRDYSVRTPPPVVITPRK